MCGSPLLRLILLAGVLALLAVPVWRLTLPSAPAPDIPVKVSSEPSGQWVDYHVALTASSPAHLQAIAANQPTASSTNAVRAFGANFSMSAKEPEDIAVSADFEERSQPSALRVEIQRGDEVLVEKTFWGTGVIEDVVIIPTK